MIRQRKVRRASRCGGALRRSGWYAVWERSAERSVMREMIVGLAMAGLLAGSVSAQEQAEAAGSIPPGSDNGGQSRATAVQDKSNRPESWAQAVDVKGVPNLFQVSDSVYRSAQPNAEGMQNLKDMGIVTVINLRSFHSDRDEIGATGLAYEHIYMKAWHPERKEVVRFLQIATDPKRTPVLVHCQHGADRTGMMIAIYRVVVQNWSREDAIQEMTTGGFGFHPIWSGLPDWIRTLDVESIRKDAGISIVTEQ